MPVRESYRLAPLQKQVVLTFLFEPIGYLDTLMQLSTGLTFRELANSGVEIDDFVRSDALSPEADIAFIGGDPIGDDPTAKECAMYWWVWKHDQERPALLPPPSDIDAWSEALFRFEASIIQSFNISPMHVRDDTGSMKILYDEFGEQDGMIRPGLQLLVQLFLGAKVLDVLV